MLLFALLCLSSAHPSASQDEWINIDTSTTWVSQCRSTVKAANLAVDDDSATHSLCTNDDESAPGWWRIDLGQEYPISGMKIFAAPGKEYANSLSETVIGISSTETLTFMYSELCYSFGGKAEVKAKSLLVVLCMSGTLKGRYVTLVRTPKARYESNSIAIGEIKIYKHIKGSRRPQWTEIKLRNMATEQCPTNSKFRSNLAVDGSIFTWSDCKANDDSPGWWLVDLETVRRIALVIIRCSPKPEDAKLLEHVTGAASMRATQFYKEEGICFSFKATTPLRPYMVNSFTCKEPVMGRYFVVARDSHAEYERGRMSIGEIHIHETDETRVHPSDDLLVMLVSVEDTVQSSDWTDCFAFRAMDRDGGTVALAMDSDMVPELEGVAWWQADLGKPASVSRVYIKTSPFTSCKPPFEHCKVISSIPGPSVIGAREHARRSKIHRFFRPPFLADMNSFENVIVDMYTKSVVELQTNLSPERVRCDEYIDKPILAFGTGIKFSCKNIVSRQYVVIAKLSGAIYPKYLALAEVNFFYTASCNSTLLLQHLTLLNFKC